MSFSSGAKAVSLLSCIIGTMIDFIGVTEDWSDGVMIKTPFPIVPVLHSNTPPLHAFASFERLNQCPADFVDISCPQSQHNVTRIEFPDELLGDLALVRNKVHFHVSPSFDPLIQCFTRHAFNRILSCRVDLRKNQSVG